MEQCKIILKAINSDLIVAWENFFSEFKDVKISYGNILADTADAIVSPANSFGYMDGGLDLQYSQHFGWDLEKKLRLVLEDQYDGELAVGQAVVINTDRDDIPYLISAPTMRVPMDVSQTVNAYLAFRAILIAIRHFNNNHTQKITNVLCPGLGTGEGRMPAERAARQMYAAYNNIVLGEKEIKGGLAWAVEGHMYLLK
ncbi:macro domain-containing protein [Candidatus Uabimicrobium sp. HlEnr_7]|uniref:macro domain-containing protein n=1 Tax=Candidatus Uabimicrobium helgolandensis TaxID=3095367 RepID=UPI0035582482